MDDRKGQELSTIDRDRARNEHQDRTRQPEAWNAGAIHVRQAVFTVTHRPLQKRTFCRTEGILSLPLPFTNGVRPFDFAQGALGLPKGAGFTPLFKELGWVGGSHVGKAVSSDRTP